MRIDDIETGLTHKLGAVEIGTGIGDKEYMVFARKAGGSLRRILPSIKPSRDPRDVIDELGRYKGKAVSGEMRISKRICDDMDILFGDRIKGKGKRN
jgi:hypothetical protein